VVLHVHTNQGSRVRLPAETTRQVPATISARFDRHRILPTKEGGNRPQPTPTGLFSTTQGPCLPLARVRPVSGGGGGRPHRGPIPGPTGLAPFSEPATADPFSSTFGIARASKRSRPRGPDGPWAGLRPGGWPSLLRPSSPGPGTRSNYYDVPPPVLRWCSVIRPAGVTCWLDRPPEPIILPCSTLALALTKCARG